MMVYSLRSRDTSTWKIALRLADDHFRSEPPRTVPTVLASETDSSRAGLTAGVAAGPE